MKMDLDPGKINIINLVSRWCGECIDHINMLENPEIKRELEKDFNVMIIDIDERPDVWERFNFGGLPSIAFLEGRERIIYGYSGYVGPKVFREIIKNILRGETEKVELKMLSEEEPEKTTLQKEIIISIIRRLEERFDWVHGGFIGEYKPIPVNEMFFLLNAFLSTGVKGYGKMVSYTLEKMAKSPLYSINAKGFYRLARAPNWSQPEKVILTELNASLAALYGSTFRVLKNPLFNRVARDLEKILTRKLFDRDSRLFMRGIYYNETRDRRFFWDINAYTAYMHLTLYKVGGSKKCYKIALEIYEKLVDNEIRHLIGHGDTYFLRDYASYLRGVLEIYMLSGDEDWIHIWMRLARELDKKFNFNDAYEDISKETGLFTKFIVRRPFTENSLIAESFLIYQMISGDTSFREKAYRILRYYTKLYENYGWRIGEYGSSCLLYYHPPPIIEISGYKKIPSKVRSLMLHNSVVKWRRDNKIQILMRVDDKIFKIK